MNGLEWALVVCIFVLAGLCLYLLIPEWQKEKRREGVAKEWQQLVEAISQTRTTLLEHAKTRPPTAAIQHMDELGSVVQRAIKNHGLNMTGRGSTKDGWLSNQTFAKELADDLLKWRDRIKAGKPWYSESQNQNQ